MHKKELAVNICPGPPPISARGPVMFRYLTLLLITGCLVCSNFFCFGTYAIIGFNNSINLRKMMNRMLQSRRRNFLNHKEERRAVDAAVLNNIGSAGSYKAR